MGGVRAGDSDSHAGSSEKGGEDREEVHYVLVWFVLKLERRRRKVLLARQRNTGAGKKGCRCTGEREI